MHLAWNSLCGFYVLNCCFDCDTRVFLIVERDFNDCLLQDEDEECVAEQHVPQSAAYNRRMTLVSKEEPIPSDIEDDEQPEGI